MRVLIMETDRHAADDAVRQLEAAGHEVVRCHERGAAAFPCNALEAAGCPFERGAPIDVALTVRAHPHPRPSAYEDGVTCALQRFVPLVVAGNAALSPFDRWTTAIGDGGAGVVAACEQAAALPIEALSHRAGLALSGVLEMLGEQTGGARAVVYRTGGRFVVDVVLPEDFEAARRGVVATHVHRAVAAEAADALGIDVRVSAGERRAPVPAAPV
jgi:hypothetical protein